jgi:hypothetical protein
MRPASASVRIRNAASTGIVRTRSGMMPASRADLTTDWCACDEVYIVPCRRSAPRWRSRAHRMPLKFDIDPPVVNNPRVVGGKAIQSRSQSSAFASSCTSAGAASQTPV